MPRRAKPTQTRVTLADRRSLPEASGVYVVRHDRCVLYVGVSCNLRARWYAHSKTKRIRTYGTDEHIEIRAYLMPITLAWVWESRLIRLLKPILNIEPCNEVLRRDRHEQRMRRYAN